MDVTGTVDYEELENWMKGRDEKAAAKYRAGKNACGDLATRPPWRPGKDRPASGKSKTSSSRLPAVSSARGSASSLDEDRHAYLRRDMSALIPMAQPTLHVEPKASQLEAAIVMHERGFQERRLVYSEERAAERAEADKIARAQRRQLKQKNQQRLVESERQRKEEIAAKFGLKMTEIAPAEWAEVEAELEAQVERREKKKRRKEQKRNDPTAVRRKRDRNKARRVEAALAIQAWVRSAYTRRVIVKQLKAEKGERERREALRQRKRMEECDVVVEKLITDLERLESMEQVELMNQLRTLQNQKVQLEEQFHAALDPTETALAKAKAKRLAEEGKFAHRWVKLQKKREDEQRAQEEALAREIERAKTKLPAIFGTVGDANATPSIPATPAVEWTALPLGQQAAATRLGFRAQCWPELEENAIAAAQHLNQDLPWDQWHAGTWRYIDQTLLLGTVASILGVTEWNWKKLKRCKPIPKPVYRIGMPPPVVVDEQKPITESEPIQLHRLAVYFSAKHEACLKAELDGQTLAGRERFYDRLCTSIRPFIRAGMPQGIACMLRDGFLQLGWAGGQTSDAVMAEPEPEPDSEPEDESTERARALAKELEQMKALANAAIAAQQPELEPEPEPEHQDGAEVATAEADNDSEAGVHLIQLRAEETLKQLHAISGSKDSQSIPTKTFGLQDNRSISEFLRTCVQTVHSLRSEYHSISTLANAAADKNEKRSTVAIVASMIHGAIARDTKEADGNSLSRVSHRMIDTFRIFDRDGDGKISPKELQLALKSLSKGSNGTIGADLSMKEIEQFMKEGDTNGDGSIDYREFVAHFQYHEAETARVAQQKVENERRQAEGAAQTAAHKLVAKHQARLEEVARETQAHIDAAEAERVLKYEARRVLPAVFNRPFEQLGLAQEPAARRLGFTPETWPRLSSAASTVVPWEKLDQAQRRLAVVLGFDEDQDPPTWVLVQIEGEHGEEDVRSLGVVTGVRHAQQEFLQEEERKRRELEVMTFRKRVFAEAARVGAGKLRHVANIEQQAIQQQHMALTDTLQEEEAKVEDDSSESDDDAFVLSEKDEQCVDAIWTWCLAGDASETLSRACLERYLLKTAGRQLTDSLYNVMCEKIGFDPDMGMPKSVFVMAFYGPYMEPGQSASAQIAAHYEKLDLANASHLAEDVTLDSPVRDAEISCAVSKEREAELRQVFACVDVNGDGTLSRAEVIMRLRKDPDLAELLGLPVRVGAAERAAFEAVFQSMDRDNDHEIDADEFVQFFAQRESDKLASGSSYPSETAEKSTTNLSIIAPNTNEVSVDLMEKDMSMQDDSPAVTPAPSTATTSNSSDSDSGEEFSIESLRAKRVQLGTPPRRGP
eukprot:COSAG02_NODE_173_length_31245_cov_413.548096_19_plen_1357_part_00